jgi:hypothetical protein
MKDQRSRFVTQIVFCLNMSFFMSYVFADLAFAQRPGPPPGSPSLKEEMRKGEVRETMLRKPDTGIAAEKVDPKRLEEAIEKVKEDFKQIQIVRNELVRDLLANKPANYKVIATKAEEISKRADRLKTYLMPPTSESSEKSQKKQLDLNDSEIKTALVQLCNRIVSFVDNPVLKNPGLTDAKQSARAGDDLLNIIELSGNIKKSAERLNKGAK